MKKIYCNPTTKTLIFAEENFLMALPGSGSHGEVSAPKRVNESLF